MSTATRLPAALAAAALLFVLATVWAAPRSSGDTFVALAGGRDVFAGKLGKPDDWSFMTSGRVWLNQNWGADALIYSAERLAGETGLLTLKGLLTCAVAAAVVFAARIRGAGWPAALLATGAALAGARWHLELRANLATYALASLLILVLLSSRRAPSRIFLAVPLMAVWANVHGGFVLGFVLLALWAASAGIAAARTGGPAAAARRAAMPGGALLASVAAAMMSPFGVANLVHPFAIARSAEWRRVTEWQAPSLTALRGTDTAWELAVLLAALIAAAGMNALRRSRGAAAAEPGRAGIDLVAFDVGLVAAMVAMSLSAGRFVPLALFSLAPVAARQIDPLLPPARWWPGAAAAAALAAVLTPFAVVVARRYAAENPRFTDETVFQRMIGADRMPSGASDFLADNGIGGRAFDEWMWEGYLRWRAPGLKLFLGGRAQQVYTLDALRAYDDVTGGAAPEETLAAREVPLAVVPLDEAPYPAMVDRLAYGPRARWVVVFYDGCAAVLADVRSPSTAALAEGVASGSVRFRDRDVGALSGAICRLSPALARRDAAAFGELAAAVLRFPTAGGPGFLLYAARDLRLPPERLVAALERVESTLAGETGRGRGKLGALKQRVAASQIVAGLYRASGRRAEAERWAARTSELAAQLQLVLEGS